MLEQTDLADRAGDEVGRLSGGNQQRVNIAIGLLRSPAALLLDEPSASLDPRQRERLWGFIGGLASEGTAVVYSTHDVGEAERYADRVLVLADGELLFTGTPGGARAGRRRRQGLRVGLRPLPPRAGPLSRDALAAAQGPADPAPLAAAGRAADRLPDRDLAAGRPRDRPPAAEAQGGVRQPRARRARASSRSAASKLDVADYAPRLFEDDRPRAREDARGGDREGPRRRGARRDGDPGRRGGAAAQHARPRRRRPAADRGLLQRVGPAQEAAGREHDHVGAWPRPTTRSRTPCSRRRPATST